MQGRPIIPKRLAATFATSAVLAAALATAALAQEKVLRIAMTAADIPKTHGQPDQGFEGNRFTGIPLYDALTHWDLSSADKPSVLIPGLATEWEVSDADKTKWVFKLRQGVKFHDGSDLKADAVVWNVAEGARQGGAALRARPDRRHRQPHAEPRVGAQGIDDYTVELTTKEPDSFLPINLTNLFMASPAHWQKKYDALARVADQAERAKQAWAAFAADASGSGPFKMAKFRPARARRVRQERRLLGPQAPAEDRPRRAAADAGGQRPHGGAALGPGRLDRGPGARRRRADQGQGLRHHTQRAAARVAVAVLLRRGLALARQAVRHAANLCVNRDELKQLLSGLMEVPKGTVPPGHPWWGNPKFEIKYDSGRRQEADAGGRLRARQAAQGEGQTSASGSGQMQPMPMNEFLQQALKECFFDVELDVIEWNTLFTNWRKGAKDPTARGAHAINVTFAAMDPFFAMVRFISTKTFPPVSNNWGYFGNAEFDELIAKARTAFADKERDEALAKLHARSSRRRPSCGWPTTWARAP